MKIRQSPLLRRWRGAWRRWSLWTALVLLVVAMLATMVWLAGRYEASLVQSRRERDTADAVSDIRVALTRNLLTSLIVYMSYSLIMAVIWMLMESPDLAITEAAVGAGITSVLFFVTLKKIHAIKGDSGREQAEK